MADRPPSFVSCATLAHELDVSESTVHEMVRRGVLPRPLKLSSGCARWRWVDVEASLTSMPGGAGLEPADPYLAGATNATAT